MACTTLGCKQPVCINMSTNTDKDTAQAQRSQSPAPSGVSMKRKWSMLEPPKFSVEPDPRQQRPHSPVPSGVSVKSDWSMLEPPKFSAESDPKKERPHSPVPSGVSVKSDWSMLEPPKFSAKPVDYDKRSRPDEHKKESADSSSVQPSKRFRSEETELDSDTGHQAPVQSSLIATKATVDGNLKEVSAQNKANLKKLIENIRECVLTPAIHTPHKSIYTDLYITEGESEGLTQEHEVLQVESGSKAQGPEETPINCSDIFKPLSGQEKRIRTVLTKGVACVGKTVLVQKFITDWTEGKANQDLDFVFLLPFPMLNRMKDSLYSLHTLLLELHPELRQLKDSDTKYKDCQVLFICFALDESSLPLDFQQNQKVCDITKESTVDALITNLIQGSLLPYARLWITSRPVASDQIPHTYINKITEVRGFTHQQKDEYFRKRISDVSKANSIITHIKTSRSLHIMCHLPVFCWIAASVLLQIPEEETSVKYPTTLTEMFIQFLLIQTTRGNQKYQGWSSQERQNVLESQKPVIMKLSELAFRHLWKTSFVFSEEELKEYDLDLTNALVHSGLCTDVFKGQSNPFRKMYTFVHVTIQEFLAAFFVFASYVDKNEDTLKLLLKGKFKVSPKDMSLDELLKNAVNRALESKSGHLDLFVRFLHGISLESNQGLLQGLLTHTESSPESIQKAIQNLKALNRSNISPDRWINLFHCLVEMHDTSVQEEVEAYLKSGEGAVKKLKLAHCLALANVLLVAKEPLNQLDLREYKTSDEGRRRLVPAVWNCRKALLVGCKLTDKCCEVVASALESVRSHLTELDLSNNDLQKSEERLFKALQSQHCKLESLRLAGCKLTATSCEALALALQAEHSHLKEMDLSSNPLEDSGVQHLSSGLKSPHCRLQKLRLSDCNITRKGCEFLVSALEGKTTGLAELHLNDNQLGEEDFLLFSKIQNLKMLK